MKVVVIGCGLAGLTSAYFLRTEGAEVVVLERAPGPARETSFANGSMISPSLADPWNSPGVFSKLVRSLSDDASPIRLHAGQIPRLASWGVRFLNSSRRRHFEFSYLENARFARFSQTVMQEMLRDDPLEFEYAADGVLKLFDDTDAFGHAVKVAHWLKQAGIRHEVLDVNALVQLEPALAPIQDRLVGALRYPDDEIGNARRFCEELKRLLEARGVDFRFSEQVLGFVKRKRRIVAVETPRGRLEADAFVLAAGSFSTPIARRLGLRLPVVPVKGYSITVPYTREGPMPRFAVVDDSMHAAAVPLGGNRLRVAGTAEFAGFDTRIRPQRIANLLSLLKQIYPGFPIGKFESWTGLRPMTPDGRPLLGSTPVDNLFLNTGHGALGWTMACGSGKVVAEAVLGRPTSYDLKAFELSRRNDTRN